VDDVFGTPLQSPLLPINLDDIHLGTTLGLEHSAQEFCNRPNLMDSFKFCTIPVARVYLYIPGQVIIYICMPDGSIMVWQWAAVIKRNVEQVTSRLQSTELLF
jgi:hypothetical protein